MKVLDVLKDIFYPDNDISHSFVLSSENNSTNSNFDKIGEITEISSHIDSNIEYIKSKYNLLINSDIILREFTLSARNRKYRAFLLFIDGMISTEVVNDYVLKPLMMKNMANSFFGSEEQIYSSHKSNSISVRKIKKFDLKDYIYNNLMPQNSLKIRSEFKDIFSSINSGCCALFVDTLNIAFDIDIKGFQTRSISKPENEVVIRGPQEAFVESIRVNTTLIRRIVNNENLIIEDIKIGKTSQTSCGICYIKNIANSDLVAETKYRLNNIDIDYLISSGQLEQLIEDNSKYSIPQIISTERPDKTGRYLLEGRVAIIVNGSPYALIVPATFIDFLDSAEDKNIKFQFANLLKFVRVFAFFITLLLPGIYVAITSFHQEFIPTELLFAIVASRASVPFSIIFEIIIMEFSFELIREASLRVPTPIGPTIGVIGALIVGQAAVDAGIVSPILIIIVAITGITSFAIPDYYLAFHCRVARFIYIIFGYFCGVLGIGFCMFIHLLLINNITSFGVSYLEPYIPSNSKINNGILAKPIWQREMRSDFLDTKRPKKQDKISMKWKYPNNS